MYYWIINEDKKPKIVPYSIRVMGFFKTCIGPYFSYKEAIAVLCKWIG